MGSPLLLGYYGDDLTGSTDVMEALASRGVPTVLFTDAPTPAERARFPEARAIGIAGTSRSETPAWMDAHLTPAFGALRALGAAVTHYKVCSTFDSGPAVGSIGRAAEIGAAVFRQDVVPLVVGAPELKRYTAQDEFTRKRDALVAEIRAARVDRTRVSRPASESVPEDFVQEQGGLY